MRQAQLAYLEIEVLRHDGAGLRLPELVQRLEGPGDPLLHRDDVVEAHLDDRSVALSVESSQL